MKDFITDIVDKDFFFHHSLSSVAKSNFFELHMHGAFEIYLFISGQAKMNIEDRIFPLSKYDLCFIRPGRFHRVIPEPKAPYERKVIRFDYSFSRHFDPDDRLIEQLENFIIIKGKDINQTRIPDIFHEICEYIDRPDFLRRIACISFLSRLLLEINSVIDRSVLPEYDSLSNERVASVIEFINNNLTEELSLDRIASEFYISKYYLSRIFKASTGSSVGDFIIKKRLVLARRLIIGGTTPGSACTQSGFSDYSSFYKSYRKYFSVPPSGSVKS